MTEDWQVSLNKTSDTIIGKNVYFQGNKERIFNYENIFIIGHSKLYNESELWSILDIPNENTILKEKHSLQILIELYKKYGFEDMLELLEGDFSFILLDYNIYGEESLLYVARDPFGIYPLYYYENPNNFQKKVQFEIETKNYGFSSSGYSESVQYNPFIAGHYQRFSHSYKVSASWKHNYRPKIFYKLPFFSIYNTNDDSNKIEYRNKQIELAIKKRIEWIHYKNKNLEKIKIGVLCLNPDPAKNILFQNIFTSVSISSKLLSINESCEFIPIIPLNLQNEDNSLIFEWSKLMTSSSSMLQIEYMEKEYPTIITRLKQLLNSNDPYVIRSHFIPIIIAKYLAENMPEIKHVFLGEHFTLDWMEKKYLDRNKRITTIYLDENMKGWTHIFATYDIEIYMPFLDRILIQNIQPIGYL